MMRRVFFSQVADAAVIVDHRFIGGVVVQGIDGEVAPGQVVLEGNAVLHHRMTPIGLDVAAKGGHLMQLPVSVKHADRAEPEPDRNGAREEAQDLLRPR